jgi:hypothetical protein
MEETLNARYTVCTIVTTDKALAVMSKEINSKGYTHEFIYRKGIEAISKELVEKSQ